MKLPRLVLVALAAALIVVLLAPAIVRRAFPAAADPAQLPVSGRLEGYQSDLGAKVPGRVAGVSVREGAFVHAGEIVVRLDDAGARARADAAAAAVTAAEERVRQNEATLAVLASQIDEAVLGARQAGADAAGRVAQAEGALAAAQAQAAAAAAAVRQAQATLMLASADRARFAALGRSGDVAAQRAEQAESGYQTASAVVAQQRAVLAAAQRTVRAAAGTLTLARSAGYNAPLRTLQAATLHRQEQQAAAQIAAAHAEAAQARALRRQAEAALRDLTVRAPADGTVIARTVEPGDVVAAGRTLLSIVDLRHVYLRGYVPEGAIGRVRVGQAARVSLDSDPAHPLEGRVSAIDAQASFTPENVYFQQDRVGQVFGVKIDLLAPDGYAKPGMPADARIDVGRP